MADFDETKLSEIIACYKQSFDSNWSGEGYKWIAVQYFQDNWNIDAENFFEMFKKATSKTVSGYARFLIFWELCLFLVPPIPQKKAKYLL